MSEAKDFGRRLRSKLFTTCCGIRFRIPTGTIRIIGLLSWYRWETDKPDWNSKNLFPTWALSATVSSRAAIVHKTSKEWRLCSDAFVIPDTCLKPSRSGCRPMFSSIDLRSWAISCTTRSLPEDPILLGSQRLLGRWTWSGISLPHWRIGSPMRWEQEHARQKDHSS